MMIDVASVTTTFVWPLFGALRASLRSSSTCYSVRVVRPSPRSGPALSLRSPELRIRNLHVVRGSFGYLRQIWLIQACWTVVLVGFLAVAVAANADMRTIAFVAAGIQAAVNGLQIILLARLRSVDAVGTLRVETLGRRRSQPCGTSSRC